MNREEIIVEGSGYNNAQVVEGYITISVNNVFEELQLTVEEVTSLYNGDHRIYMYIDNDDMDNEIKKYFGTSIEYDEDKDVWLLVDDDIISELFCQYGENA